MLVVLAPLKPVSTQFLHHFSSSKKVAKKNEFMMSCPRLYVESIETLRGQGRKKMLLSLPKELF